MATVKVSDVNGMKILKCFDTSDNVQYVSYIETPEDLLPDFDISESDE